MLVQINLVFASFAIAQTTTFITWYWRKKYSRNIQFVFLPFKVVLSQSYGCGVRLL